MARFDQGSLGHSAVKPTQVATSSGSLWEALNGKLVPLSDLWHVNRGATLRERVESSRSHAAWAPQMVELLQAALKRWPTEAKEAKSEEGRLARYQVAALAKVDKLAEWKRHCAQGHLPWRKDCVACLEAASYLRPHRRQKHPVLLNMMADLAGPYKLGEDVEVKKGKYILMVVYPFPLWGKAPTATDAPIPEDFELPEDHLDEMSEAPDVEEDPFLVELAEVIPEPPPKERVSVDKESETWTTIVDTLKAPYKVVNLCFVEILPDKRPTTVTAGLSRVYSRLRSYGFPVYGLFTDRGGEMINSAVRVWAEARSILRKTTAPESPASNGRVERMLGLVRQQARALMFASKLDVTMWPHAVRYAAEQRLRQSLAALAYPVNPMVPFWAQVTIRARTWNDKKWSTRAMKGRLVAPASEVDGGWVVRIAGPEGVRFYISTLLYLNVQSAIAPPDLSCRGDSPRTAAGWPAPVSRHRSKSPVGVPAPSASAAGLLTGMTEAVPKDPAVALGNLAPKHRHKSKGMAESPASSASVVASDAVPGSFLEELAGRVRHAESLSSPSHARPSSAPLVDKSIVEDGVPSLRRVVGSNPQYQEPSPAAGYYHVQTRVRFCRLEPFQWELIQAIRRGQVPGLGDLWVELDPAFIHALRVEHPSDLIPAAFYLERTRDWVAFPVLTAQSPSAGPLDIARVREAQHATTTSGGQYSVFYFDDLTLDQEAVLLLWIEQRVERIYEPLPDMPPRIASVSAMKPKVPTGLSTVGGDLSALAGFSHGIRESQAGQGEGFLTESGQNGLCRPRLSALRAPGNMAGMLESSFDEVDQYVLLPQGTIGDSFRLGSAISPWSEEERVSRVPDGACMPLEVIPRDSGDDDVEECSVSSLSASVQPFPGETRWYDALPGEFMHLDGEPEDVLETESLLEDLDSQRQARLKVIREQEFCLEYELRHGEGSSTKDWLAKAYMGLGELEAQMTRLQYEQLQRSGQAPFCMTPSLAGLSASESVSAGQKDSDEVQMPEPEILHTHSVSLSEVMRDLVSWHPALLEEFNSILTTHKAIRPVSKEELKRLEREGREVLYVPGKLVATVKAGTGKRKARIVACGNFLSREKAQGSPTLSRGDIFCSWVGFSCAEDPDSCSCMEILAWQYSRH